jgi:phenylacetate-CoA ligase
VASDLAQAQDVSKLHSSFTSGSTGEGARTYFDRDAWVLGRSLLKLRARLACGLRPWDRVAQFQWIPHQDTSFRRHVLRQKSFGVDRSPQEILSELLRFSPTALYGFPGYLRKLAEVADGKLRPRLIFTSGEMLTKEARAALESAYGAPVFDIYGCTEVKEIAWECPERNGYHVNADWLVVETLTESSQGAPAGSLVITSLYNYAMPIIRYCVGDLGSLREELCSCGRSLPLMAPETGRAVDYVVLPDGREVSPYTVMEPVEALPGVAQFEVLQEEIGRVLVRVVPSPIWGDETRNSIQKSLGEILPGARIEIALVNKIEPQRTGKYRIVQSKVRGVVG